jgi:hypothetical protein
MMPLLTKVVLALPALLVFWKKMKLPLLLYVTFPVPELAELPFWNTRLSREMLKVWVLVELLATPAPLMMKALFTEKV